MTIDEKLNKLLNQDEERMLRWFRQNLGASRKYKRAFIRQWVGDLTEFTYSKDGKVILPTMPNVQKLDTMLKTIRPAMVEAGLGRYEDELISSLGKRIKTANTLWTQLKFEPAKLDNLNELPLVLEHINNVRNSVLRGSIAQENEIYGALLQYSKQITERGEGIEFGQLKRTLVSKGGILPKYAGTIANTELFGMDREIRREQGKKSGLEQAKYYGVLDKLTRPFCRAHVGRIESYAYWDTVDNGTPLQPVTIYGGAWNCRHQLIPYSPEWGNIEWS